MRRLAVLLGLLAVLVPPGSATAADSCCIDIGLTARWNTQTQDITISLSTPSGYQTTGRIYEGYTRDANGVVQGVDVPTYMSSNSGTFTVRAWTTPTKDFWIQLQLQNVNGGAFALSVAASVSVPTKSGGTTTTGGGSSGGGGSTPGASTGSFKLMGGPSPATVSVGKSTAFKLIWRRDGAYVFGKTIEFEVTGLPAGAKTSSPQKLPSSADEVVFTVATTAGTPEGTYTLTFTATDGKTTQKETLILVVKSVLVSLPALPGANGTKECAAARGELQKMLAAARYVNAHLPDLLAGSATIKKQAEGLRTTVQKTLDQQAAATKTICAATVSGGYGVKPASNGTAACTAALRHIDDVNGELKKVYANLSFANATKADTWVRVRQLNTRRDRLLADLNRSVPAARKACAK